ncbi:MAG: hypothetical protein ACRDNS_11215 [Trebonia sp.]
MLTADSRPTWPAGISFSVPELMIMSAWAEYHGLRVLIELDNCVDGAVYEEVAAFYSPGLALRRWSLWRAQDAVVLERLGASPVRSPGISALLDSLIPAED